MERSPVRFTPSPARSWTLAAALALALVPAVAFALGNGKLQIHHVDIGQGDGMLLISPLGQTAMFDDGVYTNCTGIKTYLQGLGITSVDYHFLSHYHADHLGCIDDLAAIGITVAIAGYDRGFSYSSASYTSYVNTLGARRTTIAKGQTITLDAGAANPVTVTCVDLNGAGVYSVNGSDENAKSAVYKVTYGAFDEVIGGDLTGDPASGNDVETTVGPEVGDVEVYKVHHHGSRYSTNDNWLNATTPEVAVIQCGNGNSYGHPTLDALTRLHNHGVKTYWNETGAGATPDPAWDKVWGTIVVEADPGVGATYTVTGSGGTDSYVNGGGPPPPPPINTTEFPSALTMLKGSLATGDVTRLAISDDSRIGVSAGISGGKYYTDWYGSVFLAHPPLNLTVTYEGSFTVSRTQTLYLWNWGTSVWDLINSATVGTTDVTETWSTTSPAAYVSASREVRFRVKGNNRNSTYTSRGDLMSFNYDYTSGTAPMLASRPTSDLIAAVFAAPISDAAGHALVDRETEAMHAPPQGALRHVEAVSGAAGVTLTWATDLGAHLDGFNVYREDAAGSRVFVGGEAVIGESGDEVRFSYADRSGVAGGVYWLGSRSCSGPEGLLGPFRVAAAPQGGEARLAVLGNPASEAAQLEFTLERESFARLEVFDLAGRRLATPFAGKAAAGVTKAGWRLAGDDGARVSPGIYFVRLEALGRTLMGRVTVVAR